MTPAGVSGGASGPAGHRARPGGRHRATWPRLVAPAGGYTPPRLLRWPIVVGMVLLATWIAAQVAVRFGNTRASFAHDYQVLLDTFTPHP